MEKEKKTILVLCAIIILILIVSLAAIVIPEWSTAQNKYAKIYQDGNLIKTIDLSTVDKTYEFTVNGKDGEENVIQVRNGEIGIISASCPDHVCVNMGFISTGAIPITCLPNHIVIEITDEAEAQVPDGVAY